MALPGWSRVENNRTRVWKTMQGVLVFDKKLKIEFWLQETPNET